MSAKQQAIKDIREELSKQSKSFIAYRSELNRVMRELVSNQLKAQKQCQNSK